MMTTSTSAVRLSSVLKGIYPLDDTWDRELGGITLDSRRVEKGTLFMACKGAHHDGRQFVDQAIANGAAAILVEADDADWNFEHERAGVPVLPIINLHEQMAQLAARFYGEPGRTMRLIGVTGTNGKTTTTQLLAAALSAAGYRCGVIGTLGNGMSGAALADNGDGPGTTPDAVAMQRILATLQAQRADNVVMEVSSHALDQRRVLVDDYTIAVFTNLSRDHLDYHGDMETYGSAKRRLFHGRGLQLAILNYDDEYTRATERVLGGEVRCFTWSVNNAAADVHATSIAFLPHGIELDVHTPWGSFALASPLLGSFNVSNLLAVLTTLLASESLEQGFDPARLVAITAALKPVVGRMQLIEGYPVTAVIDYAHTPDGLANALQAVREHCRGRLWCVVGCGGERDRGKRPQMAALTETHADVVVLTDDNPRGEASTVILADMQAGLKSPMRAHVIADRRQAIAFALGTAAAGDVVLIAGKGHEQYQEVNGTRQPFSDAEVATGVLRSRFGNGRQEVRA
ncbi:MAG TPA: UDP-N-acetylmuramoyl-L-alanyl-D-glutamate--2,6-diaminopimelate ligase [Candidatus Acidoferrum sp.]|nr:UDP-N-acetylmuramoyl-L-alanyl-D-glutamate--2,6-diaminopimelate ligase [Candidatus Acidoferrum sp.]